MHNFTCDWRDKGAYGDTGNWALERWHWEFARRREDVREAFEKHKQRTFENDLASSKEGNEGDTDILKPDQPGFWAMTPEQLPFGMVGIPNPAISEQPNLEGLFSARGVSLELGTISRPEDFRNAAYRQPLLHFEAAVVIDRRRSLDEQLEKASALLRPHMILKKGRARKGTWLQHLRVLDAQHAGASLREIACCLFPDHENGPQIVSMAIKAANRVKDNFPT